MASIQGIYIALFGRPADPEGLDFWTDLTKGGTDLSQLIGRLTAEPEYQDRVADLTPTEIINSIYQLLFDRDADADGLAHYLALLESGEQSIETIAINILDGTDGADLVRLEAKIEAADLFTESLDTPEEIAAYNGTEAEDAGRAFIDGVDEDNQPTQDDVDAAVEQIVFPEEVAPPEEPGNPPGGGDGGGDPDVVPPSLEIAAADSALPEGKGTLVTFTFSENVSGFEQEDVLVNGGELSNFTKIDNATYTAIYTADSPELEISRPIAPAVAAISVDDGTYTDRAGNLGAGDSLEFTITDGQIARFDVEDNLVGTYDTLQQAEDAANVNERIEIYSGAELTGALVVDVPGLTINGNGASFAGGIEILAGANGSTISGLHVSGIVAGKTTSVLVRANDVTLSGNHFEAEGAKLAIETIKTADGGITDLNIVNNVIVGYDYYGIYLNPAVDSDTVVLGNHFIDNEEGMVFEGGSLQTVEGNTFEGSNIADIRVSLRGANEIGDISGLIGENEFSGNGANEVDIRVNGGAEVIGTDADDVMTVPYTSNTAGVIFNGGEGNDTITGGNGDDLLSGDGGKDTITGGLGANTLLSSEGNDTYIATVGEGVQESIDFIFTDVEHSAFLGDVTTFDFSQGNLGQRVSLDVILADETGFSGAADAIELSNGDVTTFGIGRAENADRGAYEEDFFLVRDGSDFIQSSPGQMPMGNQSVVVYALISEATDEYNVYFDANGNGDLDSGDAQIHIIGLNNADVHFGSALAPL